MPSKLQVAEWVLNGPCPINSVEDLSGGFLGPAYTTGVDTRWSDEICLGPQLLAVDLSGAGGTTANAHMAVPATKSSTEHFIYIARGTVAAKYKIDDASVTGNGITLAGECTCIIVTENTDGTVMVSYGMEDDQATSFQNSTAIGTGANDTNSANNETKKARFFGQAPDNRVVAMGGNGNKQLLQGNVLTGAVNMDASAFADIGTLRGPEGIKFTGFAMDGDVMIIGTNYGPYIFDPDDGTWNPIIQEGLTSPDNENCRGMVATSFLGVHIPLRSGSRWFKGGSTRSWGVKQFANNSSPVWGPMTAYTQTKDKWSFGAVRDEKNSNTYLVAFKPLEIEDGHNEKMTPYVIGLLASSAKSLFAIDIGFGNGVLTNPMVMIGRDTNAATFLRPLTSVPWDDSGYRFNTVLATWYGTEMRRQLLDLKIPVAWTFETKGCTSTETIQLYVSVDGKTRQKAGSVVKTNQVNLIKSRKGLQGHTIIPSIDFVTSGATKSPRVKGRLKMFYRTIPMTYDGHVLEEVR